MPQRFTGRSVVYPETPKWVIEEVNAFDMPWGGISNLQRCILFDDVAVHQDKILRDAQPDTGRGAPNDSRSNFCAFSMHEFSLLRKISAQRSGSEIRVQYDAVAGLPGFKPGEGFVDSAHREVLGLRHNVVTG